jgi:hypothetical protein
MKDCTCKIPIQVEDEKWIFGGREGSRQLEKRGEKINSNS